MSAGHSTPDGVGHVTFSLEKQWSANPTAESDPRAAPAIAVT
jgi:hypothetical protein